MVGLQSYIAQLFKCWINSHPVDNIISVPNTYPPGSDLSDAKRYPKFEQPVPGRINTSNGMSKCAGCINYFW